MAKFEPPKKVEVEKQALKSLKPIDQPAPDSLALLQLKIPEINRNEFKAHAAMLGKPMNELFLEIWDAYKKNN